MLHHLVQVCTGGKRVGGPVKAFLAVHISPARGTEIAWFSIHQELDSSRLMLGNYYPI